MPRSFHHWQLANIATRAIAQNASRASEPHRRPRHARGTDDVNRPDDPVTKPATRAFSVRENAPHASSPRVGRGDKASARAATRPVGTFADRGISQRASDDACDFPSFAVAFAVDMKLGIQAAPDPSSEAPDVTRPKVCFLQRFDGSAVKARRKGKNGSSAPFSKTGSTSNALRRYAALCVYCGDPHLGELD
jgi:hypothetical protein